MADNKIEKPSVAASLLSLIKLKKNNAQNQQNSFEPSAINTQDSVILSGLINKLEKKAEKLEQRSINLKSEVAALANQTSDYIQQRDAIIEALKNEGFTPEEINQFIYIADQEIKLNIEGCKSLLAKADRLQNRAEKLQRVLGILKGIRAVTDVVGNRISGLKEVMEEGVKVEENVVRIMTSAEVEQSMPMIAEIDNTLHKIAGNRADLLAMIDAHNAVIAKVIADKILPAENASETDYANATKFVNDIFKLPIVIIKSDLTQKILDMIADNNAKNEKEAQLTYDKNMREKKEKMVQDLKVAIRKSAEKLSILRHYSEKLVAVSEDEEQKVLANILEQINKKNPIVG
jgi:hypothetical protein